MNKLRTRYTNGSQQHQVVADGGMKILFEGEQSDAMDYMDAASIEAYASIQVVKPGETIGNIFVVASPAETTESGYNMLNAFEVQGYF